MVLLDQNMLQKEEEEKKKKKEEDQIQFFKKNY